MVSLLGTCDFLGLIPSGTKPRVLTMALVNLTWFVACLYFRTTFIGNFPKVMRFLDVASWSIHLITLGCCYGLTFNPSCWRDFTTNLYRLDSVNERGINRWLVANLIWVLLTLSFETYVHVNEGKYMMMVSYTCLYLFQYYQILYVELIIMSLKLLKERYLRLDERISNLRLTNDDTTGLKSIDEAYTNLNGLVKDFNKVFGYQMFMTLASYCLTFLSILSFCTLDIFDVESTRMIFASSASYLFICTLLIWRMLLAGEAIEEIGARVEESCYLLMTRNFSRTKLKLEVWLLSLKVKVLAPKITAAKLCNINRGVMLKLASVVTTYFIVYLQLN